MHPINELGRMLMGIWGGNLNATTLLCMFLQIVVLYASIFAQGVIFGGVNTFMFLNDRTTIFSVKYRWYIWRKWLMLAGSSAATTGVILMLCGPYMTRMQFLIYAVVQAIGHSSVYWYGYRFSESGIIEPR